MGIKKRSVRFKTFFVQYLFALLVAFLFMIVVCYFLSVILSKSGFIISVGGVEIQIENRKNDIMQAEHVIPDLIPDTCKYVVVNLEGEFLSGNMSEQETEEAWNLVKSGGRISPGFLSIGLLNAQCYYPIQRNNEICILKYPAVVQYTVSFFREWFPSPEIVLLGIFIMGLLSSITILSAIFGRKIGKRLLPMKIATEKIQNRELEFDITYSGIKEIDDVLHSMDSMKTELKTSLEKQWKTEQTKKMQISALAHDIKTPLTVVRGNAEMLIDTSQTNEQKEFTNYIMKNTTQMEQYVQLLIDISKADSGYLLQLTDMDTKLFLDELYSQIHAIAVVKQLHVEITEGSLPKTIKIDASLMQRAIINIVANAVHYSNNNDRIDFLTTVVKDKVQFVITDRGQGFSKEDIKNATERFYQGDKSRGSKLHYGMGLFIADSIVKQHEGTLTIANSPVTGGGMVTVELFHGN